MVWKRCIQGNTLRRDANIHHYKIMERAGLRRFYRLGARFAGHRECQELCVSERAHAVFRYVQASKRPANIMAS
ncbi:hypothetical protein SAMN04244548_04666 [Paracoccus pantotrophus]|nr:hypothetical protein SAMN04244548_04666 [Paracoccus pantotrophus]